jgi:hypothetical protein
MRASRSLKPVRKLKQSARRRWKPTHLTLYFFVSDKAKAGHHLRLMHVDARAPLMQRLHRHLPKGAAGVKPLLFKL